MKYAVSLAVLALSLLPSLAAAACRGEQNESAATCMPGTAWDAESGSCVSTTTS